MENIDYTLTAAFTDYEVPMFYVPPVAEPDEFVIAAVADAAPFVPAETEPLDMLPLELAPKEVIYFQEYHDGWGMFLRDDGDQLVDDERVSDWYYRTDEGKFLTQAEWEDFGLLTTQ